VESEKKSDSDSGIGAIGTVPKGIEKTRRKQEQRKVSICFSRLYSLEQHTYSEWY